MLRVGEQIEIKINGFAHDGRGVGRHEGKAVFVVGALPGETVIAAIVKDGKKFASANAIQITQPSETRIDPPCPYYEACGGCTLQHTTYESELEFKQDRVQQAVARIGGLLETKVLPVATNQQMYGYRNKVRFHVNAYRDRIALGLHGALSNRLVEVKSCMLAMEQLNDAYAILSKHFAQEKPAGDVFGECGEITLRCGKDGMIGVLLDINTINRGLADKLKHAFEMAVNELCQKEKTVASFRHGAHMTHIAGDGIIQAEILGKQFNLPLDSFMQVNSQMAEKLYSRVLHVLTDDSNNIDGKSNKGAIIDCYCGLGTITLQLAALADTVTGIEFSQSMTTAAAENAKLNGISNADFVAGDVAVILPQLVKKAGKIQAIVFDPPRAGLAPEVVEAAIKSKAEKIVYVSCDPSTLARDLKLFAAGGYEVGDVLPFDLFGRTGHVEAIILMTRSGSGEKK